MANLLRQQKLVDTNKRALIKYVLISDGTAEANTVLLDAGGLAHSLNANNQLLGAGTDRKSPYRITIKRIFGNSMSNNGIVKIQWQGPNNSEIITFGRNQRFRW
jgi:hypothetical protein